MDIAQLVQLLLVRHVVAVLEITDHILHMIHIQVLILLWEGAQAVVAVEGVQEGVLSQDGQGQARQYYTLLLRFGHSVLSAKM